jgi:hypothetical protein
MSRAAEVAARTMSTRLTYRAGFGSVRGRNADLRGALSLTVQQGVI